MMEWKAVGIGALIGAIFGYAFGMALNSFGLSVIDWVEQDYMAGGYTSPMMWAALGAFTGGSMGLIYSVSR